MKAIETHYVGPTNHRGARIIADDGDGNRVTIPYPHELSSEACHRAAAEALCAKMSWSADGMIGGELRRGYAFVFAPERS